MRGTPFLSRLAAPCLLLAVVSVLGGAALPDGSARWLALAAGLLMLAVAAAALRLSHGPGVRLLRAIEAMPCPLAVVSTTGEPLAANAAARGLSAAEVQAFAAPVAEDGVDLPGPEGRWLRVRRQTLPDGEVASLGIDVTLLKAQAAQGFVADACSRAVLQLAPVGLWQLDRAGRTVFANARLAALCGGVAPADLGSSGFRLAGPPDPDGPHGLPAGREVEASLLGSERLRRDVTVAASPWVTGPDGQELCLLALLDITPLKQARARVEHLAEHDALTGLANRAMFRSALAALAGAPDGGALLLLDLDGFRAINERHGQAAGDAVLRATAERLRAAVRPQDLVCRLGADEFAVLAFGAGTGNAEAIAARLRAELAEPLRLGEVALPLGAGIGIANAPADAREPDALLRAADLALAEARRTAAPVCLFRPELLAASEGRERLREALAEALAGDEFHLAYQPQRELSGPRLAGAEALLRWNSVRLGRAVSPGELLPAAAEAGLMPALDAWVLETALRQLAAWGDRPDAPPMLAINVSGGTLRDPEFADRVARGLLRHGVPAHRLEIEIPEDLAVRDLPGIEETLARLGALGVRAALDDFGGGHSSLPHVVRLPVQRLKLDRSIVSGLPGDGKDLAVLQATMALAQSMNIEVIGEGVETEAQAFALRRAGCTVLQGYLIGRPVPPERLVPNLVPNLVADEPGPAQRAVA